MAQTEMDQLFSPVKAIVPDLYVTIVHVTDSCVMSLWNNKIDSICIVRSSVKIRILTWRQVITACFECY